MATPLSWLAQYRALLDNGEELSRFLHVCPLSTNACGSDPYRPTRGRTFHLPLPRKEATSWPARISHPPPAPRTTARPTPPPGPMLRPTGRSPPELPTLLRQPGPRTSSAGKPCASIRTIPPR